MRRTLNALTTKLAGRVKPFLNIPTALMMALAVGGFGLSLLMVEDSMIGIADNPNTDSIPSHMTVNGVSDKSGPQPKYTVWAHFTDCDGRTPEVWSLFKTPKFSPDGELPGLYVGDTSHKWNGQITMTVSKYGAFGWTRNREPITAQHAKSNPDPGPFTSSSSLMWGNVGDAKESGGWGLYEDEIGLYTKSRTMTWHNALVRFTVIGRPKKVDAAYWEDYLQMSGILVETLLKKRGIPIPPGVTTWTFNEVGELIVGDNPFITEHFVRGNDTFSPDISLWWSTVDTISASADGEGDFTGNGFHVNRESHMHNSDGNERERRLHYTW